MPELRLAGCRTRPLAGYLKAIGVLRVVARQTDPEARGRWAGDTFELSSALDRDELNRFFLERYAPTPIVSPWNGGSGFFPKDDTDAFDAITADRSPRLEAFRDAIDASRRTLRELGLEAKPEPKTEKPALLRALRSSLPDEALQWLDAAIVLLGEEIGYPPLLGSGGNDGRYDFSNNYARAVVRVLGLRGDRVNPTNWLAGALDGASAPLVRGMSLAHLSRDASPSNSPQGESDALGNPWELVLALEGALAFSAGAARRHGSALAGPLVAPFTVATTGAGYGSSLDGEKGRAEVWLPVWSGRASLSELESVVREARAQVGRRQVRDGLDFARAAGELGVARGVGGFERYAVLERAGQSSLAVPAGRIAVHERLTVSVLRSLDRWLDGFRRYARGGCPAAHKAALRNLDRALFDFAASGTRADAGWVLATLGAAEATLAAGGRRAEEHGLWPLSRAPAREWLEAVDDGSPEVAVAAGLASLRDARPGGLPAVRDYLHGTGLDGHGRRSYASSSRGAVPRRGDPAARLAAIHARRHLDAAKVGSPLAFERGIRVPAAAASALATGALDLGRVVGLVGGLCLLDFAGMSWQLRADTGAYVDPTFAVLALAWAGLPKQPLEPRPGWAARLAAGQVGAVLNDATLRLRMAELPPLAEPADLAVAAPDGICLSAALLLHVRTGDRLRLAETLLVPQRSTTEGETT